MAGRAKKPSGAKSCDVCGKKIHIYSKCPECDEHLCYNCTIAHKGSRLTRNHKMMEYGKGVPKKTEYCLDHPSEEIAMFCSQCLDVVCKLCIIGSHNAHTFSDLRSVANIKREDVTSCVTSIKDRYIPGLQAQIVAVEKIIKQNETDGENRVKEIKERGDDIRDKVDEIVTNHIAESRQKENRYYNMLADIKNELNSSISDLTSLITERETIVKNGSDVEIIRSAKQLLSIDLEAKVESQEKRWKNLDNTQYTVECTTVSEKVLEGYVGYVKEGESEAEKSSDVDTGNTYVKLAEKSSDVDTGDTYVKLVVGMHPLVDMSESNILTPLFTIYEQRTFSQHQHGCLVKFGLQLSNLLIRKVTPALCRDPDTGDNVTKLYLALGDFLYFSGYFKESENVYRGCMKSLSGLDDTDLTLSRRFQCLVKLLDVRIVKCSYNDAQITCAEAFNLWGTLKKRGICVNSSALCALQAHLLYSTESKNTEAQDLCDEAINQLTDQLPPETILTVLHQCLKVCTNADNLKKASVLVKYAKKFASEKFGEQHPMYAQTLDYYGWYLLKIDLIDDSVEAYENSVNILTDVFGPSNIWVAKIKGELAYALYVQEYTSGNFEKGRGYATDSTSVLEELLPNDSMMLCAAKRAKALILEEIALDSGSEDIKMKLLEEAELLHRSSLEISRKTVGEHCIVTSNYYGNLGRLYQSMDKIKEAEEMLLKSIKIYEELLGRENSDLAAKLGHLASLYTYDTHQYDKAEKLYLRSISTIIKIYGKDYTSLEYDYKGLIQVYKNTGNKTKERQFTEELNKWQDSQKKSKKSRDSMASDIPSDINSVIQMYFRMKK